MREFLREIGTRRTSTRGNMGSILELDIED